MKSIGKTIVRLTYEYSDGSEEVIDFTKKSEPVTKSINPKVLSLEQKCPKCALDLSIAMGYSCPNPDCPVYSQVSC